MGLTVLNVFYVLVAIAMIAFILMQRGAGAQAGSGFGAGASATVFGARGASSFLTRATAALATLFFAVSLGMGMWIAHHHGERGDADLGVMGRAAPAAVESNAAATPAAETPVAPAATAEPAAVPASDVPQAPQAPAPAETPPSN